MNPNTEQPPRGAVEHFAPVTAGLTWSRAPEGFSGAVVWRGDDSSGAPRVALKGWPVGTAPERIKQIHSWLARAAHLPFVPTVFAGARGSGAVLADGRCWDACRWMPGAPLLAPTTSEVCAACEGIAQLHRAWPADAVARPCAAVVARLRMLLDHRALYASESGLPAAHRELGPLLHRAAREVARLAPATTAALRPWAERGLSTRPCVRDLRAEHVLFHNTRLGGIVDYGAMAPDTPATDLARFLGDVSNTAPAHFDDGLRAYRRANGPLGAPDEFVRLLASSGAVCSLLGWLVRVLALREPIARPAAVASRLAALLATSARILHVG